MIKTILFVIVGLIFILIFRQLRPEYSFLTRLAVIAIVSVALVSAVTAVIDYVGDFSLVTGMENDYIKIGIKILGISIITQTASDVCKDCGEQALSTQVEFVGRIALIGISLPMIERLVELSVSLISE